MSVDDRRVAIVAATVPLLLEHGAGVTTGQIARAAGIAEGTVFRAFTDKRALLLACLHTAFDPAEVIRRLGAIPSDTPLRERLDRAAEAMAVHWERAMAVGHAVRGAGCGPPGVQGSGTADRPAVGPLPVDSPAAGPTAVSPQDAGPQDAGRRDAGRRDAGRRDAGPQNAGPQNAERAGNGGPPIDRGEVVRALHRALGDLLRPDGAAFRLPVERAAQLFLGLVTSDRMVARVLGGEAPAPADRAELIDLFLHGALTTGELT